MKQSKIKFTGRKFIAAAFLSASVLLTSFTTNAAAKTQTIEILSGENTKVQFAGSTADALLFKVHISNEKGDNFTVTIKNSAGDVLYSNSFSTVDFQKQFKVLKGDQTNDTYYVTITSRNKNLEDSYAITSTSRTIEDVVVNKL
jgi:hypothetical protein